jgi:hypothetical protein
VLFVLVPVARPLCAQAAPSLLDPARTAVLTDGAAHAPLPEEYIWTAGDVTVRRPDRSKFSWSRTDLRTEPHLFRTHFHVVKVPQSGTLYLAGPRWARVYLNGTLLGEFSTNTDQPINFRVFHADATHALRAGDNLLAVEAIRGRGVVSGAGPDSTHQIAYGEVLVAKLLAGPFGGESAPALVITNRNWRSHVGLVDGDWMNTDFDDSAWPGVESLGPVESDVDLMQWSADAGMYGWPGYRGMSSSLRNFVLPPAQMTHVYDGNGSFEHLDELTSERPSEDFAVTLHEPAATDAEAPSLLLDFGREIAGRILIESASTEDMVVSVAYGESELEALATGITPEQRGGNYLGTNLIDIPPNGIARGPKSAFRYVRIRFLRGAPVMRFRSIRVEGITYPVTYMGSFDSSDPELNRIWETAAYTAHLSMQDGIWDAPKRDRGRWAGDLNVEGRVILDAFGDKFLLEDTLRRLAEGTTPGQPVNGIAGYTAQWISTLSILYARTGDRAFITNEHDVLLRLLRTMDDDLDPATGLLKSTARGWGFVDWAPGLYGNTSGARIGTTLEFLRAYEDAPALLRAAGDETDAQHYEAQAAHLREAARAAYLSPATQTVGDTWQLNALAVLTDLDPAQNAAIWNDVFAHVKQDAPSDPEISPYFNAYLLDAMARTGHDREALDWMRAYWGGMLKEGATSFWESYDLRWPKTDFHLSLQADGTSGFFVSLAHGWSSGPVAWLSENVLGVLPAAPGYDAVELHPHLLGLAFVRGSVATPHGPIVVSLDQVKGLTLDLPKGVESARLFLPTKSGGEAAPIRLTHSGHYTFALP